MSVSPAMEAFVLKRIPEGWHWYYQPRGHAIFFQEGFRRWMNENVGAQGEFWQVYRDMRTIIATKDEGAIVHLKLRWG